MTSNPSPPSPAMKFSNLNSEVLIVDDDEAARLLVSTALKNAKIDVATAGDAETALTMIVERCPACVVLDVVMPGMSGLDLCRLLRGRPETAHLPILIMTSLDDFESIDAAYAAGATDFSPKGISPRLLVERIRFMLRAKADHERLVMSEWRLRCAQQLARVGHAQWDARGELMSVSETLLQILRLQPQTKLSFQDIVARVHRDDAAKLQEAVAFARRASKSYSVEHRLAWADGTERSVVQEGQFVGDESADHGSHLVTLQDVTDQRRAERRAHYLTYVDELTGLPNRTLLRERIEGLLARRDHAPFAVFAINLAEFRRFNESLGQAAGDELLRLIATRMQRVIRDSDLYARDVMPDAAGNDTVARIGGDEFVLVATRVGDMEPARAVARRLQSQMQQSFEIAGQKVHVSVKIGISFAIRDGAEAEVLLTKASTAASMATGADEGIQFYDEEFNARALRRMSLEQALRRAVDTLEEFELHFQPRIATAEQRLVGAEALIRWNHPELGRVRPDEFIALAEQLGLIETLGEWVFRKAIAQMAAWRHDRIPCEFVSVNLSPVQMRNGNRALKHIFEALEAASLPPSALEVEITEGVLIRQPQSAVRLCEALHGAGVGISLDDFGTGYSALGYLRHFPVTAIKIDRSFVTDVPTSRESQAIVRSILALSHGLGLKTVAEGVETHDQAEYLFAAGCEQLQGYLFARPMSVREFEHWHRVWRPANTLAPIAIAR